MENLYIKNEKKSYDTLKLKNNKQRAFLFITCVSLWGCGGTGQDQGQVSSSSQVFSGLALDGQIARATVYIDANNNGKRDPWEMSAFTDNHGYYSFNPITDTNYCRADASEQDASYCLRSLSPLASTVIRVEGGYDILTSEPFLGQLSRRIDAETMDGTENTIISPLTSIVSNAESADEMHDILSSLGISDVDDLDVNYLDMQNNASEDMDVTLFSTAIKLHKIVTLLSDRINDNYKQIGGSFGAPNDASMLIYSSLAEYILSSGLSLYDIVSNEQSLLHILESSEVDIRATYVDRDYALPTDIDSSSGNSIFNRVTQVAVSISDIVDNLFSDDMILSSDDALGSSRALEALIIKIVDETQLDTSIENAIRFFSDTNNDALVFALLNSLQGEAGDVSGLVGNDFTGEDFDSPEEVEVASSQPIGSEPFSNVSGSTLKVSDLNLGRSDDLNDREVEFYFDGEVGDTQGSFSACAKYIDGAKNDGSLGEVSTQGTLVDGFWSLLGANNEDTQSFSVLITVTFLGSTYQAILKAGGTQIIAGDEYERIRFDFGEELRAWHSKDGIQASTEPWPTTNEECRDRLPLRIQFNG